MLKLGVNIDHVATLRQARYRDTPDLWRSEPDPVAAALLAEQAGAHGITAHLREDRRHIIDRDLQCLRDSISTPLNLELADVPEMVEIAIRTKPYIVCLVPEHRSEITTEGGLDVRGCEASLKRTTQRLNDAGIRVSLFIDPDLAQIEAATRVGAQAIELHTGRYADHFNRKDERNVELQRLIQSARAAYSAGLVVNAGHGLTVGNVPVLHVVPHLAELNIGHTLISRALFVGLTAAIQEMLDVMKGYRP
ncbi:MAG: pyridoxine 5'-phosphate synthase [Verrucomicrobia bacterium]|nr:pyridoxine 5'-phosphate synthase [Verrucomicrobiota bacterium]